MAVAFLLIECLIVLKYYIDAKRNAAHQVNVFFFSKCHRFETLLAFDAYSTLKISKKM